MLAELTRRPENVVWQLLVVGSFVVVVLHSLSELCVSPRGKFGRDAVVCADEAPL